MSRTQASLFPLTKWTLLTVVRICCSCRTATTTCNNYTIAVIAFSRNTIMKFSHFLSRVVSVYYTIA